MTNVYSIIFYECIHNISEYNNILINIYNLIYILHNKIHFVFILIEYFNLYINNIIILNIMMKKWLIYLIDQTNFVFIKFMHDLNIII